MNKRYAFGLCGLACLSVATSLFTVNLAAWAAQTTGEIPKMTPFEVPPSIGRYAVDVANLNERGPSKLASVQGSISLPVRYQIKTGTRFANSPYRLVVKFLEPCSSCGEAGRGDEVREPIAWFNSPAFTPGGKLHLNEVVPLTLPCPPGTYRISIAVERYIEAIDRERGPIAEWEVLSARTYPDVTVR